MIRDLHGNIIPMGKVIRTLNENFLAISELPNWLEVSGSTSGYNYSIVGPDIDYGYLQLTTPTIQNSDCVLSILPSGINMDKIKEIVLSVDALVFESADVEFYLELVNGTYKGVSLACENGGYTDIRIRKADGVYSIPVNYDLLGMNGFKRKRNITLRIRSDKKIVLMEGDSVFFEKTVNDAAINGILYPRMVIKNMSSDQSQFLRISALSLSIIHN
ncbi:hypothetical protein EWH99_10770 [Sporolactobacillus sp. THM7-7]|nr:hypothetical protein EWH99_10770 [Sporolactobacillus sp. THM7-7]